MSRLTKLNILGLLQEHGAILNGHFKLSSGLHSETYVQTAVVLQYPHLANKVAKAMVAQFPRDVDVIVSPAMGAVVIGQEVARVKKSRAIFTERINGMMTLRRDFQLNAGERVMIVEDVLTTGRSINEIIHLAKGRGAKIVGIPSIIDRSTGSLPFTVPFRALLSYPLQIYPPESCGLCQRGIPIIVPGTKQLQTGL